MSVRDHKRADCHRRRGGCTAIVLLVLVSSSGCWEEIHYTPSAEAPEEPASDDVAGGADMAAEGEPEGPGAPPTDAAASTEQESPPEPPSTSDLFASQENEADTPPPQEESSELPGDDVAGVQEGPDSILPTPPAPEAASDAEAGEGMARAPATPATAAGRHQAWQAVSKWSLAAAIHAKGLPNAPQDPILAEASAAAAALGIELPELPSVAREDNLEAAVIEGLRGELAVAVSNAYANRFGEAEAAAADLAIRSHLLLLTYSPRNADAVMEAGGLRRAGEASGLPAELWTPLVELVEERAPFLEVRQAVFDLHRRVDALLSEAANRS